MKVILPYVEEHAKFKKAVWSLEKYSPELEVIKIKDEKREGADKIFSDCFKKYDEDLIIWHSDMYATKGWLDKLKEYYDLFDIIGCKLVYPNDLIQFYGGYLKAGGIACHPHQFLMDIGLDKPMECLFVTFGGCLIKKKVFKKLGEMDSQFYPTYYGDVDYCLRARKEGFKIGVVPVKLIHEESFDNRKNPELQNLVQRNHARFVNKWMSNLEDGEKEV